MIETFITSTLWFAAIGCALMAGIYFAFSTFVMASFARIETAAGIAAMQSINDVILGSAFMPLFFGTSLASVGLAAFAALNPPNLSMIATLSAGTLYFSGMFLCTILFNVPLNNKLKDADPYSATGAAVWDLYLHGWTRWNHIRTIASTVSSILFFIATQGELV